MEPFLTPKGAYRRQLLSLVQTALAEDIGAGDRTTDALDLGSRRAQANLVAKSSGILAGADAFIQTFRTLDRNARISWCIDEGESFDPGLTVAVIRARPSTLLSAERTALNFLAHLSGIATSTRRMVERVGSAQTRILDTRKTTPGWRFLEKRAAHLGGAVNHRFGLFDALMIKSNHVGAVGDFAQTVRRAQAHRKGRLLVCEVRTLPEIRIALEVGVRWLLLDHFSLPRLRQAVSEIRRFEQDHGLHRDSRIFVEVSGNVSERRIPAIVRCGVDYISSGSITHSAPASDFSLRWQDDVTAKSA